MSVSQNDVDAWFAANPSATSDQVAAAVQSIGGLDANAGLADILANRYSIAPTEVQNYYSNFTAPKSTASAATDVVTNLQSAGLQDTAHPTLVNPLNSLGSVDNTALAQSFQPTAVAGVENTYDKLVSQIMGQGLTGKWTGQGFGSADANLRDMAGILSNVGITDLSQFGLVDSVSESTQQVYQDYAFDDQTDSTRPTGRYYTLVGDGEKQYVDPSTVSTDSSGDSPTYVTTIQTPTKTYGNTVTGQALPNTYGERQTGNAFGGTYAGKGNTAYRVDMSTGKPIFYTTGASSNTLATMFADDPILGMIANVAAATFGGPLGTAALAAAQGKDIGDIAKAYVLSDMAGSISSGVSGAEGVVDAIGQTGANIAGRVVGSVATGGGKEGAIANLISGGVNAAMPDIQSMIPGFPDLSPAQQAFVNKAITNTLKDGKLSSADLVDAAIASGKVAFKNSGGKAPVEDMGPTSFGTNITTQLTDAGLSEGDVALPPGIQTASTDGGFPVRAEVSGAPIFSDSRNAANAQPPAGYALASSNDEVLNEPAQYDDNDRLLPKSDGTYYDITQNAWFKPSGEFGLSNVPDYSGLFNGDQANLASAGGSDSGKDQSSGLSYNDILDLTGNTMPGSGSPSNQDILDAIGHVPDGDAGTIEITDKRPVAYDAGEIEIVGDRIPPDDAGVVEVVGDRPVADDAGEIEIVGERPIAPENLPEVSPPVVAPPIKPLTANAPVKPPAVTPPKVTPKQVAQMLGVSASSPIVQDVMEALYGTMDYLDISKEFSPSERKAKPAATQKQQQQTKMAQGGYLDSLLAENTSVDDLLNLLR